MKKIFFIIFILGLTSCYDEPQQDGVMKQVQQDSFVRVDVTIGPMETDTIFVDLSSE